MSASPLPETSQRPDWPRLVARKVNNYEGRISALEAGGGGGGGSGTVTSVALSVPSIFSLTGSPITTSGTFNVSLASQTANTFLAAPNGLAGSPTFRAIVVADVPTLNQNTTGSAATLSTSRDFSISGGGITAAAVGFNGSAAVTLSASVDAGHITLARMANLAANSIIGNNTGAGATPLALTTAQTTAMLDVATPALKGLMSTTDKAKLDNDLAPVIMAVDAAARGPAIADYFASTLSLEATSTYEIECNAVFLKTTAGTVTWTWNCSSAPTMLTSRYDSTPVTGYTGATVTGAPVAAQATSKAVAATAHAASGSLTTAVDHNVIFRVLIRTNAATTIQLRSTESVGTLTPRAGSYMRARKIA